MKKRLLILLILLISLSLTNCGGGNLVDSLEKVEFSDSEILGMPIFRGKKIWIGGESRNVKYIAGNILDCKIVDGLYECDIVGEIPLDEPPELVNISDSTKSFYQTFVSASGELGVSSNSSFLKSMDINLKGKQKAELLISETIKAEVGSNAGQIAYEMNETLRPVPPDRIRYAVLTAVLTSVYYEIYNEVDVNRTNIGDAKSIMNINGNFYGTSGTKYRQNFVTILTSEVVRGDEVTFNDDDPNKLSFMTINNLNEKSYQ